MFYIKEIRLTNFRCHENAAFIFSPSINILTGKNACGKTSVAEAVYCLSLGKSYKTGSDKELIKHGADYGIIRAVVYNGGKNDELLFSLSPNNKKVEINSKIYSRLSDYIGYFNVSIFCPEDYRLIKGAPRDRRNFFDVSISQIQPEYLRTLIRYRRILKQRNEMLKKMAEKQSNDYTLLSVLTEQLITEGKRIIESRTAFTDNMNSYFLDKVNIISGGREHGVITYKPDTPADMLKRMFSNKISFEVARKMTLFGPHRDDFQISINGRPSERFASQGQQRTLILAMKLSLTDILREKETPLLIILDDVFSELDLLRQNQILGMINGQSQVFITTTSVDNFSLASIKGGNIINIEAEESH